MLKVEIYSNKANAIPNKYSKAKRRNILQLILDELSFSGKTMTVNQIAQAIDYLADRTERVLKRLEKRGQIMRTSEGRWTIVLTGPAKRNGHAAATVMEKIAVSNERDNRTL